MDIKRYLLDYYINNNGEVITPELAAMLVEELAITDGSDRTNGEKWSMSDTTDAGMKAGVDFDSISKAEWYYVMNMMYSDYFQIGKRYGNTDWQFFADLAKAWFEDVDGKENKTFKYAFC